MNNRMLVLAAGTACVAGLANGQSYSGNTQVNGGCGPALQHTFGGPEFGSTSSHGDCVFTDGLASINDASAAYLLTPGGFMFDVEAHSNFLGTRIFSGSAGVTCDMFFSASDLIFTDVADPQRHGIFGPYSLNFDVAFDEATVEVSNCNPNQHAATVYFITTCGGSRASGRYEMHAGAVTEASGTFEGRLPGEGVFPAVASETFQDLNKFITFEFLISLQSSVLYCDHPPAEVGDSHARLVWSLPCGRPVFNLPPGITANSVELGIVDNMRVPAIITGQPEPMAACPGGDASYSVIASGVGPFAYQWQWKPAGGTDFIDVADGANTDPLTVASAFVASGARSATLDLAACARGEAGMFRCIVFGTCGSVTSAEASFAVCSADLNCDHLVDLSDFFDFLNCFDQTLPCADIDGASGVDLGDFFAFLNAFDVSC